MRGTPPSRPGSRLWITAGCAQDRLASAEERSPDRPTAVSPGSWRPSARPPPPGLGAARQPVELGGPCAGVEPKPRGAGPPVAFPTQAVATSRYRPRPAATSRDQERDPLDAGPGSGSGSGSATGSDPATQTWTDPAPPGASRPAAGGTWCPVALPSGATYGPVVPLAPRRRSDGHATPTGRGTGWQRSWSAVTATDRTHRCTNGQGAPHRQRGWSVLTATGSIAAARTGRGRQTDSEVALLRGGRGAHQGLAAGNDTRNAVPVPGVLSTSTVPAWAATSAATMDSPSPLPLACGAARERAGSAR